MVLVRYFAHVLYITYCIRCILLFAAEVHSKLAYLQYRCTYVHTYSKLRKADLNTFYPVVVSTGH